MTRPVKEKCGCTHNGARWLSECGTHKEANDALHVQAMADHIGANPSDYPKRWGTPDTAVSPTLAAESDWLALPAASPT